MGDRRAGEDMPLVPGVHVRVVWPGARNSSEGDDPVLSALALRRRQALRLLDVRKLPGGLQHVRCQWHPLQPRISSSGWHLRDEKGYIECREDRRTEAGKTCSGKFGLEEGLGPRERLRQSHVDDVADGYF